MHIIYIAVFKTAVTKRFHREGEIKTEQIIYYNIKKNQRQQVGEKNC